MAAHIVRRFSFPFPGPAGLAVAGSRIYLVIRCLHIPVLPHAGQVNLRFVKV